MRYLCRVGILCYFYISLCTAITWPWQNSDSGRQQKALSGYPLAIVSHVQEKNSTTIIMMLKENYYQNRKYIVNLKTKLARHAVVSAKHNVFEIHSRHFRTPFIEVVIHQNLFRSQCKKFRELESEIWFDLKARKGVCWLSCLQLASMLPKCSFLADHGSITCFKHSWSIVRAILAIEFDFQHSLLQSVDQPGPQLVLYRS